MKKVNSEILDYRGEPCPGPLVKTVRKISNMREGSEIYILTDIEECMKTIRETLELLDIKEVNVKRETSYWVIHVKK